MLSHSAIIALVLATTFGAVTSDPISSGLEHRPNLTARNNYESSQCKNLEELDYRQKCFYQEPGALEGGVSAYGLLTWLEAAQSKAKNGYRWSYTLATKPGERRCRQISCLSAFATLNLCDLRPGPPERNHTWAASTVYSTVDSLFWRFWPELPTSDAEGRKVAAQRQSDTKTCCSPYYNPNRVPQTTDRMWGEQYQAEETGLRITIEGVRQPYGHSNPNIKAMCDDIDNMSPMYDTEAEGEDDLEAWEWKDFDPSWKLKRFTKPLLY
ncbi:hypothetical protein TWF506_002960 [Arthrobotrys conoides]|uniref:Uncharacterized protein n=1 Tax=Arthrobotrys conoides TaxID=74498 RepID=A0AAN8RUB2_9PEZI